MIHEPRDIKDRVAVGDDIFIIEELEGGRVRLIPDPTHVLEVGTPINKALLQPIEDALGEITRKLSGIEEGAQVNTVTSVAGKTGAVTLTKSDVGLGNVQNYGIATQAQAQAGTANDVYMTPLRVKEATRVEFDAHKSSADHDGRYYTKSQLLPIIHYLALDYWTSRNSGTSYDLRGVAYANGLWVVVGGSGTILTSTNGTSWTSRSSGTSSSLLGVAYANGLWVAVGGSGTILISLDGTTWTLCDSGTSSSLLGVAYADGLWVAVEGSGTILISLDGTTWIPRDSGTSSSLWDVAYGNGLWVAVGFGGMILTAQVITL